MSARSGLTDAGKARYAAIAAFWAKPVVHPAADKLPMMSDDEIAELAADIKRNGLQQPIIVWEDNSAAMVKEHGEDGPFPMYLLDGRNRLAALRLLGHKGDPTNVDKAKGARFGSDYAVSYVSARWQQSTFTNQGLGKPRWMAQVNPVTFVLSANVKRRHLTSAQKRDVIAAFIKEDPKANNSTVAKELGVSDKTVASVRTDLESRSEIPNVAARTDSKGRQQPAHKPKRDVPKPKPEPQTSTLKDRLLNEAMNFEGNAASSEALGGNPIAMYPKDLRKLAALLREAVEAIK